MIHAETLAGRNVYISGPMTGVANNNAAAFATVHAVLLKAGCAAIYDPVQEWFRVTNHEWHPHEWWMRKSIAELARPGSDGMPLYDTVVVLPGWRESGGAMTEVNNAKAMGMDVLFVDDENDGIEQWSASV